MIVLVTVYFNIIAYKQCVLTYRRSIKLMLKYKGHWIRKYVVLYDRHCFLFYRYYCVTLHCILCCFIIYLQNVLSLMY